MIMKKSVFTISVVFGFACMLIIPAEVSAQFKLTVVEKMVQNAHPVPNISHDRLKQILASKDSNQVVIFDVREPEEYKMSHVRKAVNISSEISESDFARLYGTAIKGKLVVFYCSVGYRSSICLERLKNVFKQYNAVQIANLLGGIFRWYNEGNLVVNAKGQTNDMHPYNQHWGKLVQKRD